ncbi:MAG TPA: 50S ribosomal protein L19 [candidate division WOR-3 bacterium]|uniref:50S ribosomal protein L19 n=1 Tax=candidate division WOR-3 bacterium TaxID=2052148 RepID=A0A9C9JZT4_UNCW3|nr:50S ribosomal protein L19 [candidate division WOR-3 bacterium]
MAGIPDIKPGDLVKVYTKIKEGDKERITPFQGVVIQMRGKALSRTFTVRKISAGIGIERIFPLHSPMITKIEIKKKGKVRRAKLGYLRKRRGRKMKIKEATRLTRKTDETGEEKEPVAEEIASSVESQQEVKSTEEKKAAPDEVKKEEKTGEGVSGQKSVEKT